MYSLKDHIEKPLVESSKNVHLDHVEDLILNDGLAGAHIALNFIENVAKNLAGGDKSVNVTTKWDGSPAVVCGVNPENGRFFVGTKAVFSKRSPKIIYTRDDIKKYYKDKPGLQKQFEELLTHLPKIDINGVLQGDMMFSSGEVSEQTIKGKKYTTFKPNTILYAIPFESELAERIRRSKIGIVFHTTYEGDKMKELAPQFSVNLDELKQSKDVWFDDATYKDVSGKVSLTQDEYETILRHLDDAEAAVKGVNAIRLEQLLASSALVDMIKMHTNNEIRGGKQFHENYVKKLYQFVENRIENESIREQTKEKKKKQYAALLNRVEPVLAKVLSFQDSITQAKSILIKKLQNIDSMGTFVPNKDGSYDVTKQEGFVAVDHLTNKAVKLVDRLDFSRMNQLRFK
jgi:hypothetical protein